MADFKTQVITPGFNGLDLKRELSKIDPNAASRLTNLVRNYDGELTGRPGITNIAQTSGPGAGGVVHSLTRINNPVGNTAYRLAGLGTELRRVAIGDTALVRIDDGYSGNPLSFVNYRPPLSGASWCYVGDSSRMRKVDVSTGTDLPIGLPVPIRPTLRFRIDEFAATPDASITPRDQMRFLLFGFDLIEAPNGPLAQLDTIQKTTVEAFNPVGAGGASAGWTNNAGTGGAGTNTIFISTPPNLPARGVRFTSNVGAAVGLYYNYWGKANPVDFSLVGSREAFDDDQLHLWAYISNPAKVDEVRIYFVVSAAFDATIIPGTSTTLNLDAYVKAVRPADFTDFFEVAETTTPAATSTNTTTQTLATLPSIQDSRPGAVETVVSQIDPATSQSKELIGGKNAPTEFGTLGIPLRRGEFRRLGSTADRGWNTITGIVVVLITNGTTTGIELNLGDCWLFGGYGPDVSTIGNTDYDYRSTNYDPTTGTESNPTGIQAVQYQSQPIRGGIVLTPWSYVGDGSANIVQRFYRRGGTLQADWYYVGQNASNGAAFYDFLSDDKIVNANTVSIDNDQPCTTVNSAGTTVLAQPLKSIFGPCQDLLFGCGDPNRPGNLYYTKKGEPDHWPSYANVEVCDPSEELVAGFVYGGEPFVFSRETLYKIIIGINADGLVTALPTQCAKGLASLRGIAIGQGAVYFVNRVGIFATNGGPEQSLTDDSIRPLFFSTTRNGIPAIDWTYADKVRLEVHENDLWLLYQNRNGTVTILIYSLTMKYWREYDFPIELASLHSEIVNNLDVNVNSRLILGSVASSPGIIYEHSGTSDNGTLISAVYRSGALNQGFPRDLKQFGDLFIMADRAVTTFTVTCYLDDETITLAAQTITTGTGITRYILNPFDTAGLFGTPGPRLARNVSIGVTWAGINGSPPILYELGPSFILQPDETITRVSDWTDLGRGSDKWFKGLIIECDTSNQTKTVAVQLDGATVNTQVITASGRKVIELAFTRTRGRLIRLKPTDTNPWLVYSWHWIFDEEPFKLTRWETQELDHGIKGWQVPIYAFITLECIDTVSFNLYVANQTGVITAYLYTIPATGIGVKAKVYVPFEAAKGVTFRYLFISNSDFYLYREESYVCIRPWGTSGTLEVKPFGTDDLDGVRGLRDAGTNAARSGGGS